MNNLLVCFILGMTSISAWAQMDPSAMAITQSSSSAPDDGLQNNRYVVKKHKTKHHKKERIPASDPDAATQSVPAPVPDLQNAQVAPLPQLGGDQGAQTPVSNEFNNSSAPQPDVNPQNPNFGHKMRDLLLGGDLDSIDKYRSFLDVDDIRKNIFEFTLATSYLYNTSVSPYFYRNYISSAPDAYVGLDIWLTPFLGIDADYRATLLDEVKDSATQEIYTSDSQTWFDLGFKIRRFFGLAVNSPSLVIGLRYAQYDFAVSPGAQTRLKTDSQGPELTVDINVPTSRCYSWNFGVSVDPLITQIETPVGPDIRSGGDNQTIGFGVNLGGEYRMSRQTRAFFKFSTEVYKTQFAGQTMANDLVTGSTQLNVPVTNLFYMIDLGVHLGR